MVHALTRIATSVRHDSVAIGVETLLAGDLAAKARRRPSSRSPSGPFASRTAGTCRVGITSTCTGAFASMSLKGQRVVRSLDDLCWNLTRHDLAEQTVSHDLPAIWLPWSTRGGGQGGGLEPQAYGHRARSAGIRRESMASRSSDVKPAFRPDRHRDRTLIQRARVAAHRRHRPATRLRRFARAMKSTSGTGGSTSGAHAAPHCLVASSTTRRSFSR